MNRARALSQVAACLKGRIPQDADWLSILSLANENWFTAELYVSLRGAELPEDVSVFLGEVHRRNLERNADLFATLKDALAALNGSGLEPVLLKGCALWAVADDVPAAPQSGRTLSDLDFVAPPGTFEPLAPEAAGSGCRSRSPRSSRPG